MPTFYDAANFIVNAGNSFLQLVRGNLPGAIAFLAAAFPTIEQGFEFIFDATAATVQATQSALDALDTTIPFLQSVADFMSSFAYIYYPKMNAYFPVDFLMSAMGVYIVLVVVGVVIRSIKSFVPTIS